MKLKRLPKYLVKHPRLVYRYAWQQAPTHLQLVVDTDIAGCKINRRSTSGGAAMYGKHCIRHWSSTQTTLALSSGEAELGGICKGATMGMGLRSVAADLGITYDVHLLTDATAATGMTRRLGIGNIRHLDVSVLWIQQKVRDNDMLLSRIASKEHPGYSFTKYRSGPEIRAHMQMMRLELEGGRAASAPALT